MPFVHNNDTMSEMKKDRLINVETRFGNFECLFEANNPEKGYTVTVPKLKGIVTFGDNLKEAKKMAREAIELHCECLLREGIAEIIVRKHPRRPVKAREYAGA